MKNTIDSSKIFQREKLQSSDYSLLFIVFIMYVIIDYASNDFSISLREYTVIFFVGVIIVTLYNYNITTTIILLDDSIIIKKKLNRSYTYKIKDITVSEKKRLTNTLQKYYVLLLKSPNGRKFKLNSTYWPKYYELKKMLVKLGVYYE